MSVAIGNYIVTCNREHVGIAFYTFTEAQAWVNKELRKKECCNAPEILIAKVEGIALPYRAVQWKWQDAGGVEGGLIALDILPVEDAVNEEVEEWEEGEA